MSEITSNDRAFLAVYKEIQRLESARGTLKRSLDIIDKILPSTFSGLSHIDNPFVVSLLKSLQECHESQEVVRKELRRVEAQLEQQRELKKAYDAGQDIIASRLALD